MENTKLLRAGVLLAYPLAYLYLRFVFESPFMFESIGITVFALLFAAFNTIIEKGRGKTLPRETYFWYACLILTAASVNMAPSPGVSVFGLHLCAVYTGLVSGNVLTEGRTGSFIVRDLFEGFILRSFPNMGLLFKDWKEVFGKKNDEAQKLSSSPLFVLLGIGILIFMLPLFLLALSLLGDINPAFALATEGLGDLIIFDIGINNIIMRCLFAFPVCLFLYGLISSCAADRGISRAVSLEKALNQRAARRNVPAGFTCVITAAFSALYLIFFGFEALTLSAWLKDRFLVVEYARRGFFELVGIMLINMVIFLVVNSFAKRDGASYRVNKALLCTLMTESLLFSCLSFLKLFMYFYKWGYTIKRMLAMWGAWVLGAAAVMALISIIRGKDKSGLWIRLTAVSYIVMCLLSGVCAALAL